MGQLPEIQIDIVKRINMRWRITDHYTGAPQIKGVGGGVSSVLRIHRFHRFLRFLASSKSGRIEGIENVESKVFSSLDSTYSIHSVLRISITCKHKQDYGTVWISDKKKKNPARFEFSVDAAVVLSLSLALSLSLSLSTECPFHAAPSPIRPATHVDR